MRTIVVTLFICFLGFAAFYDITDGFTVLTSEASRRLSIRQYPVFVPDVQLVDIEDKKQSFRTLLARDGRVALVAFIYTRCNAVCSVLGDEFQQLQQAIITAGLQHQVRLLSISFDPMHDQPAELQRYAQRMKADSSVWSFASTVNTKELSQLLSTFGIVVIPDAAGEFVHNAAIHLVTADGKLTRIYDVAEFRQALHETRVSYVRK